MYFKKIIVFILISAFLCVSNVNLFADAEYLSRKRVMELYEKEFFTNQISFLSSGAVRNGEFYSIGFWGSELGKEIELVPESKKEMQLFRKNNMIGFSISLLGFLMPFVATKTMDKEDLQNGAGVVVATTSILGVFGGLIWSAKSYNHTYKAIDYYNQAVLSGELEEKKGE